MGLDGVRAVLLDMDGTLVDSDAAVERAWVAWAMRYGVDPARVLDIAHGSPSDTTVRKLLGDVGDAAVAESSAYQLALQYEDLDDVVATSGAHELLETLLHRGLGWAVVTSANRRLAAARLGAAGIPDPPVLVTIEDVTAGKPDPESYLVAARRLGVSPEESLVVEDTETGLQAGRAAGAMTCGLKGLDADLSVADLGELGDLLT